MMDKPSRERLETRTEIFKAMAHPTRLYILEQLREKEHCVCELTALIDADTSTISKHLSLLKHAGLISSRKKGTSVYYSLNCPCVLEYMTCIEQVVLTRQRGKHNHTGELR